MPVGTRQENRQHATLSELAPAELEAVAASRTDAGGSGRWRRWSCVRGSLRGTGWGWRHGR